MWWSPLARSAPVLNGLVSLCSRVEKQGPVLHLLLPDPRLDFRLSPRLLCIPAGWCLGHSGCRVYLQVVLWGNGARAMTSGVLCNSQPCQVHEDMGECLNLNTEPVLGSSSSPA